MNKVRLHQRVARTLAISLEYFEWMDKHGSDPEAAFSELTLDIPRWVTRVRSDPVFAARVRSVTASILTIIEEESDDDEA